MKIWYIPVAILLILFLIGQIRLGVQGEYNVEGARIWLKFWLFPIQILPMKPKKKKRKKPAPKKEKQQSEPEKKPEKSAGKPVSERVGGALDYARGLLPVVLEGAKAFYRKLQVDTLDMELIVGAPDPADAAMLYGRSSAILGSLWYPLTHAFHVKDGRARTRLDFDAGEMTLYAKATLTIKLGQIIWLGFYFGLRSLKAFLSVRNKRKKATKQDRKAA